MLLVDVNVSNGGAAAASAACGIMRSTATEAANTDIQNVRRIHSSQRSRVDRTRSRGAEEGPERPTGRPSGVRQASGAGAPGQGKAFGPRSSLQGGNS